MLAAVLVPDSLPKGALNVEEGRHCDPGTQSDSMAEKAGMTVSFQRVRKEDYACSEFVQKCTSRFSECGGSLNPTSSSKPETRKQESTGCWKPHGRRFELDDCPGRASPLCLLA